MLSTTGDFTFVGPTEILAFNDALPDFARINTTVLGTSSSAYLRLARAPPRAVPLTRHDLRHRTHRQPRTGSHLDRL
jgi:hypothetical protein